MREERVVVTLLRALAVVERAEQLAVDATQGVAIGLLSIDGRRAASRGLYERSAAHAADGSLSDWEQRWYVAALPLAPANVLLGGAGRGREVSWLRARGYEVVAFEPAASLAASIPGGLVGDYEALSRPSTPEERAFAEAVRSRAPYDAVVLGWGSFTHVASEDDRLGLLRTLRGLCGGPVLVSCWVSSAHPVSRAHRLGFRIGRALGGGAPVELGRDRVLPHCGYAHVFSREELDALAARAGYDTRWEGRAGDYPHVTLVPGAPRGA